jgi:hypothetical protein
MKKMGTNTKKTPMWGIKAKLTSPQPNKTPIIF